MVRDYVGYILAHINEDGRFQETWTEEKDQISVTYALAKPYEQLTKADMLEMTSQYGITTLESLEVRNHDAGQLCSVVDEQAKIWKFSGAHNLGTGTDIRNIRTIINIKSEAELKEQPYIRKLYEEYLKGEKKRLEEKVFPQYSAIFSAIAKRHQITYNPQTTSFNITFHQLDEESVDLLLPTMVSMQISHLENALDKEIFNVKKPDQFTVEIRFGYEQYERVKEGFVGQLDCNKLSGCTAINDHYTEAYEFRLKQINAGYGLGHHLANNNNSLAASIETFSGILFRVESLITSSDKAQNQKPPSQMRRMDDAGKWARECNIRYSIRFPLTLENVQYITDFVHDDPNVIIETIVAQNRVDLTLLSQLENQKKTKGQVIFTVPFEMREAILGRLQASKLPRLTVSIVDEGILVTRTVEKLVQDQEINNNNNNASSKEAVKISTSSAIIISRGILTAIKDAIPKGGTPENYAKEIKTFVTDNITTHESTGSLPEERRKQLISALSDALIANLKAFQNEKKSVADLLGEALEALDKVMAGNTALMPKHFPSAQI